MTGSKPSSSTSKSQELVNLLSSDEDEKTKKINQEKNVNWKTKWNDNYELVKI